MPALSKPEVLGKNHLELWQHLKTTAMSTWRGKLLVSLWGAGTLASLWVGISKTLRKRDHTKDQKRDETKVRTSASKQVFEILKLAFPSVFSKSFAFLLIYTASLIGRIVLTIKIAKITGKLGKMVGARTFTKMFHLQVVFGLWCIPAALVNSLMSFSCNHLALAIREQLLKHINSKYLSNLVFYRTNNLGKDKMEDVDQRVTQDLKKFSTQIAELYGNLLKPVLELVLISNTLGKLMGMKHLMGFFSYFLIAGQWIRFVMPRFAEMTATHAKLEGEFRANHMRLITHAEEIAFYGGSEREKVLIDNSFKKVKQLDYKQYLLQGIMGVLDGYLVKYGASMVAYSMLIPAVYLGEQGLKGKSTSAIMEYYLTCTQLFIALGTACKNLVLSYKRIQSLTGLSIRVTELLEMLKRRSTDQDEKEMKALAASNPDKKGGAPKVIEGGDAISFQDVDIFSPTGELLAKGLTFTVAKNTNVLVSGRNGCGKSSLFRILGGLWPLCSGTLVKPAKSDLFYVPQRPYMVPGTLRDQITYPLSINNKEDAKLNELMEIVQLSYLVEREGAWDAVKDWANVLSGGEKQRVAMARLFYHRPAFGILDECTSAVSVDVEAKIYETCSKLGITIFTVSHRPQLKHHHDYMLRFDGEGGWEWVNLHENA